MKTENAASNKPKSSAPPDSSLQVTSTGLHPSSSPPNPRVRRRPRSTGLLPDNVVPEPQCYLSRIPIELLAEILMYMPSTQTVLALARCSKYFCATLVNNDSSVFIWRNVRATSKPYAIPDPTPNFTEPAYAAFIFDCGECEVCRVGFSFGDSDLTLSGRYARIKLPPCTCHSLCGLACAAG